MLWVPGPVRREALTRRAAHDDIDRAPNKFDEARCPYVAQVRLCDSSPDVVVPIGGDGIGIQLDAGDDIEARSRKPGGEAASACV